jgi:uncharacterized membrane protein YgdD (TMEM256/DUF423 family)
MINLIIFDSSVQYYSALLFNYQDLEMKKNNNWIITGGIFGFLGVAIGAFGAHGLKNYLTPEMMETYHTGVLYQLVHSIVILVIGFNGDKKYGVAAAFFTMGIILFSFSLYLYSITYTPVFAIITPFGGVSFLIGWLMIVMKTVISKE